MNEREILERSIKEHRQALDKAETDLMALAKPEPKQGDVRYHRPDDPIVLMGNNWWNYQKKLSGGKNESVWLAYPFQFNIFDDLARNAEDLEEFEVKWMDESGKDKYGNVTAELAGGNCIWLHIATESASYTIDQVTEIHQKLGRVLATARRKQK